MDVIDEVVRPSATGVLVEAHGPERRDLDLRIGIQLGQRLEILDRDTGQLGNLLGGVIGNEFFVFVEGDRFGLAGITLRFAVSTGITVAGCIFFKRMRRTQAEADVGSALLEVDVPVDESLIYLAIGDDVIGNVIKNCQIRLRRENHRNVGQLVGAVLEGRQHSNLDALIRQFTVSDTRPQNRVHLGHIRPPEHEGIGMLDIVVAAHRLVDTKGAHEAGNCRGHTVARIGIEVVGAEASFHQFGSGIALPNGPLARTEHGEAIRALGLQGLLDLEFHDVESLSPGDRHEFTVLVVLAVLHAQQRRLETVAAIHDLGQEIALDTVQTAIDRRIRIALRGDNAAFLRTDQHTATSTAETARRLIPANIVLAGSNRCRRSRHAGC